MTEGVRGIQKYNTKINLPIYFHRVSENPSKRGIRERERETKTHAMMKAIKTGTTIFHFLTALSHVLPKNPVHCLLLFLLFSYFL